MYNNQTYYVVGHFHYVLSMGAVYALIGGFYYWIGKITGYQYSEVGAQIHFWVFTIAINIVFFPMHFQGQAGMPRRIPDYADGFQYWNSFMSQGSAQTLFSLIVFIFNVRKIFEKNHLSLVVKKQYNITFYFLRL